MTAPFVNVAAHLSALAQTEPERAAIILTRNIETAKPKITQISFRQLDTESGLLARGLANCGLGRGIRVALLVPPSPEFSRSRLPYSKWGQSPY